MKTLHIVSFILVIVGGLNWLLTGLFPLWDLASYITDGGARLVYILIGVAAIVEIVKAKSHKMTPQSTPNTPPQNSDQMNQPM